MLHSDSALLDAPGDTLCVSNKLTAPPSPLASIALHSPRGASISKRNVVVGGPWAAYPLCAPEAMTKLRQQCALQTGVHRARWATHHREIESVDQVTRCQIVDVYTTLVALTLTPLVIVVYALLLVASLPGFAVARAYMSQLTHPLTSIERDRTFQLVSSLLWVLALPSHCLIGIYWLVVCPVILACSVLYSLASLKIRHIRFNLFILRTCGHWPKWKWRDTVCGFLGAMERMGWTRFALLFPTSVVVVPVLKYLFGANPFLYKLSMRHCSQWTSSLDLEDNEAVAAVVQSTSWTFPGDHNKQSEHAEQLDNFVTTGHIQLPPLERAVMMVFGVHFANSLVTFSNTEHNVNGSVIHSKLARRGIYNTMLYTWNPCHYLTGYVEVNLQHDGGIEQPMWCITGDNYIGNQLFQRCEGLVWHYIPAGTGQQSATATTSSSNKKQQQSLAAIHSVITIDPALDAVIAI